MKNFSIILLSSCMLLSNSLLRALSAEQAGVLMSDIAAIKQGVQLLLSQSGGGGGAAVAAPVSVKPVAAPATPAQLARDLATMVTRATRETSFTPRVLESIARLKEVNGDVNFSFSGGKTEDTALFKASTGNLLDVQRSLWDAGARLTPKEKARLKGFKDTSATIGTSLIEEVAKSLDEA